MTYPILIRRSPMMTAAGMPDTPPMMLLLPIPLTLLSIAISVSRQNRSNSRACQLLSLLDPELQLTGRDQITRQVVTSLPGSLCLVHPTCSRTRRSSTRSSQGCSSRSTTRGWRRSSSKTLPMQMLLDRRRQRAREPSSIGRRKSSRSNRRRDNGRHRYCCTSTILNGNFPGSRLCSSGGRMLLTVLVVFRFPDPGVSQLRGSLVRCEAVVPCSLEGVLFYAHAVQETLRRLILRIWVALFFQT